ncbi:MAG: hypothetical protein ACREDK_05090 [Thermoplasmata archaeon]
MSARTARRSSAIARIVLGAVLVVAIAAPLATAASTGAGVTLTLGSNGSVTATLRLDDPNGSALRYAMDGNFSPLIEALPINTSQKATYLTEIGFAESSPLLSSYFGNHDGQVSSGEVALLETLVMNEASLLPSGTFTGTGTVVLRLNGAAATNGHLASVVFDHAEGADASPAPVTVVTTLTYELPYGSGDQNLTFGIHLPGPLVGLPTPGLAPEVNVSLTTPAPTTIGATSGLTGVAVTNDVWGWGGASVAGTYDPVSNGTVTVLFHPSFPTGDVALGAGAAVAIGAVGLLLLRRRRRSRIPRIPPGALSSSSGATDEKVGPSGSE